MAGPGEGGRRRGWEVGKSRSHRALQALIMKCRLDFPGGPAVKALCFTADGTGLSPGRGTKTPHPAGQRRLRATTTKPTCSKACGPQLEEASTGCNKDPAPPKIIFFLKFGLSFKQQSDEILAESPRSPVLIALEPDTHTQLPSLLPLQPKQPASNEDLSACVHTGGENMWPPRKTPQCLQSLREDAG